MWDAQQYLKFAAERARPFLDLVARVNHDAPKLIVDLGCGPGELTRTLAERWPTARVVGIDNSPEMLAKAVPLAIDARLDFVESDIATWMPSRSVDVLVSNAALQWVPNHDRLIPRLAEMIAPGGTLAIQIPDHFAMPTHRTIAAVLDEPRWRHLRPFGLQEGVIRPLPWYCEQLGGLGFVVDAWETTYLHILAGNDAVLEWIRGTALRPYLTRLSPSESADFEAELSPHLRASYPTHSGRTMFPFPRMFIVARQSG